MGYREVAVEEIKEVLRLWLGLAVCCPALKMNTMAAPSVRTNGGSWCAS